MSVSLTPPSGTSVATAAPVEAAPVAAPDAGIQPGRDAAEETSGAAVNMPTSEEIRTAVAAAVAFEAARDISKTRPNEWPVMVRGWAIPTEPFRYNEEQIAQAWQREYMLQNTDGTQMMLAPHEAFWPLLPVDPNQPQSQWRLGLTADDAGVTMSITAPDGRKSEMTMWQNANADAANPVAFGFQADFDFVAFAGDFTRAVNDAPA